MTLPNPTITLTTDFGDADGYVGAMKGVITSICPGARLVDIAHHLRPQEITQAAMILASIIGYYPRGTIHVAVVDPTVGTDRRRIVVCLATATLVGPDNGIFGLVLRYLRPERIIAIENEKFMLRGPATTFDGRDVFAPVAAHLACGLDPSALGAEIEKLTPLAWPENQRFERGITGAVVSIDYFGNLITSITREELPTTVSSFTVEIKKLRIDAPAIKYHTPRAVGGGGELRALFGSMGYLEIAAAGSSAEQKLSANRGDVVQLRW